MQLSFIGDALEFQFLLKSIGAGVLTAEALSQLTQEIQTMSEKVDTLNTKIDDLNTAIETEHQEVLAELAKQQSSIDDLKALLASGASPDDLNAAIARIEESTANVQGIVTPSEPTPPTP